MKIEVPATLEIDLILSNHDIPENVKKDGLLYLIHLVYYMIVLNPDNVINGWTNLNSQLIKGVIGNNYKVYIDFLIKIGIIKRSYYVVGVKSYGYKIANINYDLIYHKLIDINDNRIIRKIKSQKDSSYLVSENVKKNYKYLSKWFDDKLKINIPEDLSFSQKIQLNYINENKYRMSIDKFGKRLHTNLTNIPRNLRKYLTYDNQSLVEIDIKNSQFFMAIKLLMDYLKKNDSDFFKEIHLKKNNTEKIEYIKNQNEYNDIANYILDVTNGNFYERFVNDYRNEKKLFLDREDAKKLMLRIMFSKPSYNDDFKKIFKKRYPTVYNIFNNKKINNDLKINKYKALAQTLQRIESGLLLRTVCKNNSLLNVPIFTIHDSILTTQNNIDIIKEVLIQESVNKIGFEPTLTINKL